MSKLWQPKVTPPPLAPVVTGSGTDASIARGEPSFIPNYLPQLKVFEAEFENIPIPANTDFGTLAGWYKFGSWKPEGHGLYNVSGAHFQMLPCDVDAAGDGVISAPNAANWGNRFGKRACIVIGVNLPGKLFEWAAAVAPFAGMGSAGQSVYTPMPGPDYIARQYFPAGALDDDLVWRRDIPRAFGVNVHRIGANRALEVALVIDPNQGTSAKPNNNASALTLCGSATVHVHCGLVESGASY